MLFDQEVSFQYCCEFVRCWRNEPKKSFVILRKIGFMVGRTLRGGARMRYRGATRLARSRGEEQSRLWQGLPYLLLGGIHQPELSADVCGLGSERGTVVPGKVAYRTFLHVGTVTRRIDLLLPSGGFWSANAYEARHSLWRGGVMMGSGIDVAAAPDGPDALDPAPRRLAVEIHPTWDLRHPVWESRIFDIQALARLPARFSF